MIISPVFHKLSEALKLQVIANRQIIFLLIIIRVAWNNNMQNKVWDWEEGTTIGE